MVTFKTSEQAIDHYHDLQNGNIPSDCEVENQCLCAIIWNVEELTRSEWILVDEILRLKDHKNGNKYDVQSIR